MNWQQILTWLIPAILGVALRLTMVKPLDKQIIIRAIVQGCCIGYFANKLCIIKEWIAYVSFVAGGAAFLAEYLLQFIIKFKWSIFKKAINASIPADETGQ